MKLHAAPTPPCLNNPKYCTSVHAHNSGPFALPVAMPQHVHFAAAPAPAKAPSMHCHPTTRSVSGLLFLLPPPPLLPWQAPHQYRLFTHETSRPPISSPPMSMPPNVHAALPHVVPTPAVAPFPRVTLLSYAMSSRALLGPRPAGRSSCRSAVVGPAGTRPPGLSGNREVW